MAERRPLVLIDGVQTVLPTGDTLPGSGGGGLSWTVFANRDTTVQTLTAVTTAMTRLSTTIPANTLQVGDRIMVRTRFRATNGTTASNFVVSLRTAATVRATSTVALGTTAITNRTHSVDFTLVVETVGATCTASVLTETRSNTTFTVGSGANTGLVTLGASNAGLALDIQANMSVATGVAFTSQRCDIEIVR